MEARERTPSVAEDFDPERRSQIKSRDRVRGLAEVYTHEREVDAMLDLVPDMFPTGEEPGKIDCTFLEPACGDGNFLIEILRRKLRHVTPQRYGRAEYFEHRILRAIASIYAVDINDDNVSEARARMRGVIEVHLERYLSGEEPSLGFRSAVEAILETNVIRADALSDQVELVSYEPGNGGTFRREWSCLDSVTFQPNLFSAVPRRDQVRLHYSELSDCPSPVLRDPIEDKVA